MHEATLWQLLTTKFFLNAGGVYHSELNVKENLLGYHSLKKICYSWTSVLLFACSSSTVA